MAIEGYRFVRVLLPEELAQKCDAYRTEHHLSWDALAVDALRKIVNRGKGPTRAALRRRAKTEVRSTRSGPPRRTVAQGLPPLGETVAAPRRMDIPHIRGVRERFNAVPRSH
jgi:hypothetical protein